MMMHFALLVLALFASGCSTVPRAVQKPFSTPASKEYCGYFLERKDGKYTVRYVAEEEEQVPGLNGSGARHAVREEPYDEAQVLRLFEMTGNSDIRSHFRNNYGERTLSGVVGGISLLPLGALLATGGTENGAVQMVVGLITIIGVASVVNAFRDPKDALVREYNQRVRKLCP